MSTTSKEAQKISKLLEEGPEHFGLSPHIIVSASTMTPHPWEKNSSIEVSRSRSSRTDVLWQTFRQRQGKNFALVLTARRLVPQGTKVKIMVDNTSVMYAVRKERSSSYELNAGVIALCNWFEVDSIDYIKSEENPADALSRGQPLQPQLLVKAIEMGQRNGKVEGAA
jgi:hypothetical protein